MKKKRGQYRSRYIFFNACILTRYISQAPSSTDRTIFIRCDELFKYLPNLDLRHDKLYVIYRCSDYVEASC